MATQQNLTVKREVISLALKNIRLPNGDNAGAGNAKVLNLTVRLPEGLTRREMLSSIGDLAKNLVLPERTSRVRPTSPVDRANYALFVRIQAEGPHATEAEEALLSELQDLGKIENDPASENVYLIK